MIELEGRDLTALFLGDPVLKREDVGIIVFGSREEVALAVREGPHDRWGRCQLAYPVRWDGERCQVAVAKVRADAVCRVETVDWDDLDDFRPLEDWGLG